MAEVYNEIENNHDQLDIIKATNFHCNRSSRVAIVQRIKFMEYFSSKNG